MKVRFTQFVLFVFVSVKAWSVDMVADSVVYIAGDCNMNLVFEVYAQYSNLVDDQTIFNPQDPPVSGDYIGVQVYDGNCNLIVNATSFIDLGSPMEPLSFAAQFLNVSPPFAPPVSGPFTFAFYDLPGQTPGVDTPIATLISDPTEDGYCTALPTVASPECVELVAAVPTVSQWGFMVAILMTLVIGIVVVRQFHVVKFKVGHKF